jgi:hypothetical protein
MEAKNEIVKATRGGTQRATAIPAVWKGSTGVFRKVELVITDTIALYFVSLYQERRDVSSKLLLPCENPQMW